jgi:hypothetical protein
MGYFSVKMLSVSRPLANVRREGFIREESDLGWKDISIMLDEENEDKSTHKVQFLVHD